MPIIYLFNKFPYHLNPSRGWTVGGKAHKQVQVRMQTRAMFRKIIWQHISKALKNVYSV